MAVWCDPLLPQIEIPEDLKERTFRLGSASYKLLPKQYVYLAAQEQFVGYISGYGGGKTRIGAIKSALLSMEPNNRGLIGMEASTDLEEAAQRDTLDFLHEAGLLKEAPNARTRKAIVHCIDPRTMENLGYTSEITFAHLDDPKHVRGRHLGWFWVDEGSKVKREAWQNLIGRLRLPSMKKKYKAMVTGNPEGHNWIYNFFFDREQLESLICGCNLPDCEICPLPRDQQNAKMRLMRRAIHCTSFENYFLPSDYLANMVSSFTEEERKRYLESNFDIFEGQVFKEFTLETHAFTPPESWVDGRPPREWKRLVACDVGGASPWAFLWAAADPWGNIIFYDEIYRTTTNVQSLAEEALPKMVDEDRTPYSFRARVIDYENKLAAEDLRRCGILFTNAQKHDKLVSVNRLSNYFHPNPKHHYPEWHPRAGSPGSPRAFVSYKCRNLLREVPQQRWRQVAESTRDELDPIVPKHATDCALYISRELPDPTKLQPMKHAVVNDNTSKMSQMYWYDAKREEERQARGEPRRRYQLYFVHGLDV